MLDYGLQYVVVCPLSEYLGSSQGVVLYLVTTRAAVHAWL